MDGLYKYLEKKSSPTRITFLPPIRHAITEYKTVVLCIHQSQRLSRASNMKFAHITVDAGAAQRFYHVVWNNPIEFQDVIIHMGDFHAMMEFFGNVGKLVTGSGFEEVIYQAGSCTSGWHESASLWRTLYQKLDGPRMLRRGNRKTILRCISAEHSTRSRKHAADRSFRNESE